MLKFAGARHDFFLDWKTVIQQGNPHNMERLLIHLLKKEMEKEKQLPQKSLAFSGGGTKFPKEGAETWTINLGDVPNQKKPGH